MADEMLHTFLFADISGFSLLTEREGDEVAADMAIHFVSAAATIAEKYGAEVVKGVGDAVMIRCDCPAESIRMGLELVAEFDDDPALPQIHAGLHIGPAIRRAGDWFGATVNLAARMAEAACAGQLLVTEAAKAAAGELGSTHWMGIGPLRFKNIQRPVEVYAAYRTPVPSLLVA
jgi:class 3 adenylate cyclase